MVANCYTYCDIIVMAVVAVEMYYAWCLAIHFKWLAGDQNVVVGAVTESLRLNRIMN